VGKRRGLRTAAQQPTRNIAGSSLSSDSRIGSIAPKCRVPVTALMAWPNFHREMEERSTNRWQHRLKREHPTCTERINRSPKSADGRVATGLVGARSMNRAKSKNTVRLLPFLPDGMVTDRSSPSRVRYAAKNAPLTAPGRSANPPPGRKGTFVGKANQNLLDTDRPSHGRPLHVLRTG
jgi:hypothetical protein